MVDSCGRPLHIIDEVREVASGFERAREFLSGTRPTRSGLALHFSGEAWNTFLAQPMKLFYMHRALKFVRAENDYALLPDFGLTDSAGLQTACIELWANSAGPKDRQTLLSKKWGTRSEEHTSESSHEDLSRMPSSA